MRHIYKCIFHREQDNPIINISSDIAKSDSEFANTRSIKRKMHISQVHDTMVKKDIGDVTHNLEMNLINIRKVGKIIVFLCLNLATVRR